MERGFPETKEPAVAVVRAVKKALRRNPQGR